MARSQRGQRPSAATWTRIPQSVIESAHRLLRRSAHAADRPAPAQPTQSFFRPIAAQHPPGVRDPKGGPPVAQDQALTDVFAWADEGYGASSLAAMRSAYLEGMTWLGYPELSVLAQRAEYRVASEEIAAEMTREWIEIKSTGEKDKGPKIRELTEAVTEVKLRDHLRPAIRQ